MAWDPTLFNKELDKVKRSKSSISLSRTNILKTMAMQHAEHHDHIAKAIIEFIQRAPADYRVSGLYVMDAICNSEREHSQTIYINQFATLLQDQALSGRFMDCNEKDKGKVQKLLGIWKKRRIYDSALIDDLERSLMENSANDKDQGPFTSSMNNISSLPPPAIDTATLMNSIRSLGDMGAQNTTMTTSPPPPTSTAPNELDIINQLVYNNSNSNNAYPAESTFDTPLSGTLLKILDGIISSDSNNTPVAVAPVESSSPHLQHISNDLRLNSSSSSPPPPPFYAPPFVQPAQQLQQYHHQPQQQQWTMPPPQQWPIPPHQQQQQPFGLAHPLLFDGSPPANPRPPLPTRQGVIQLSHPEIPSPSPPPASYPHPSAQSDFPKHDRTLQPGHIRVLTRSLFVGPIPPDYEEDDLKKIFSKYGDIVSIIIPKRTPKHNAFLKFSTHQATRSAKYALTNITIDSKKVKVNWAFGFGPKRFFNYDAGESIIPLSALTEDERNGLQTSQLGGFNGHPVQDQMAIEEPATDYKPEWRKDTHYPYRRQQEQYYQAESSTTQNRGKRRSSYEDTPKRKKTRWGDNNHGFGDDFGDDSWDS